MNENTITVQLDSDMLLIKISDIVGTSEVAEILSCPKQQIHALRKRADFPKPITTLAATPLWNATDIKFFAITWKRRKSV